MTSPAAVSPAPVSPAPRPTLAVWKFASCDGCQLTVLDCEDDLLALAGRVDIAYFLEAGVDIDLDGRTFDISLVEGSITTPADIERIQAVRDASRTLVTIGACATSGGIQALRNLTDVEEYLGIVYATPQFIDTLGTSTPISAHVPVDLELRGCPITKRALLETISALLAGRRPDLPSYSVCAECKAMGNVCVAVTRDVVCLGPVTQAGCGALCPRYARGCYGCFGPAEAANVDAFARDLEAHGTARPEIVRLLRTFACASPTFAATSARLAEGGDA